MAKILWLASFPKSGNTWLRAFLANYIQNPAAPVDINALPHFVWGDMRAEAYEKLCGKRGEDLSREELSRLRPEAHRLMAQHASDLIFVKTHSVFAVLDGVPAITPEVTFGAVYVVRNPLDVAVSFASHYALPIEHAVKAICFEGLAIEPKPGHVRQVVSDWTSHVRSWLGAPGLRLKAIRYEDLSARPRETFAGVLAFLGLAPDAERLARAIRFSSFRELARQESRAGFIERSKGAERFFRKGRVGGWRRELAPAQVEAIVRRHREVMIEQGYLSPAGKLLV